MKNIWIPFFTLILTVSSCSKDFEDVTSNQEVSSISLRGKMDKVSICHYDEDTDTWKTLNVSGNSLKGHLKHGDVFGECSIFPTNGLVAWFPFNGNANDESGNNNIGITMGNVVLENDRFGNPESSYYFPGQTDSYINVSQNSTFSQFQEGITLSIWYRVISYNLNPRIIEIGNTDGGNKGFRSTTSGRFGAWDVFAIDDSGTGLGVSSLPSHQIIINEWEHLVTSFDFITGEYKLYINGVLITEGVPSPYVNNFGMYDLSDRIFNIGRKTESAFDPWEGSIDDIGIWNRVLSTQEIESIYNSSKN